MTAYSGDWCKLLGWTNEHWRYRSLQRTGKTRADPAGGLGGFQHQLWEGENDGDAVQISSNYFPIHIFNISGVAYLVTLGMGTSSRGSTQTPCLGTSVNRFSSVPTKFTFLRAFEAPSPKLRPISTQWRPSPDRMWTCSVEGESEQQQVWKGSRWRWDGEVKCNFCLTFFSLHAICSTGQSWGRACKFRSPYVCSKNSKACARLFSTLKDFLTMVM